MFFLTRVKGVYTFDDADSKRKMVIDVPKKQALINFDDWHLSFSGNSLLSLSRENGDIRANVKYSLLYELLSIVFSSTYLNYTKWEKIELVDRAISLSERYPDLHFGNYINIVSGMFNGKFIQFCLNEGIDFHMGSWRTFLKLERIKQMPQDVQGICLEYQEIFGDEGFKKENLVKLARLLKHNSEKQINKSMLCKLVNLLYEMPELWEEVRTQDNFFKVYNRIYKIYCLKESNEYLKQIVKNESQIIEIEDMTTKNYCVVVPRSLEDLITEGQQQNNCVGYYYCEDIAENFSLIYFIRRKDNKSKSVYTCRYDTLMNGTVEFRGFNNSEIIDKEVLSFLDKIDYRLRSILKG